MKVIKPIPLLVGMLTSSTAPETFATYSAVTNYLPNDLVTYSSHIYRCLSACVGKTPGVVTSATYWEDRGQTYVAWSSATAYVVDNRASYEGNIYVCIANNTNKIPDASTSTSYWSVSEVTNTEAMFDSEISTVTYAKDSLTVVLTPGPFDSVALFGLTGAIVNVLVKSSSGGTTIKDETISIEDYTFGIFSEVDPTVRAWSGMTTLGTNVYACAIAGSIYKQTGGTGTFVSLNQTVRAWTGMTSDGVNVYACVSGGDIYKQTNGTGDFVALSQTARSWSGMTVKGTDVYACVVGGDIYKQTGGTGNFIALSQTSRSWSGMTTLGTDVYACAYGSDIYKQTGGTGNFIALGQGGYAWISMTTLGTDVYACRNRQGVTTLPALYIQVGGVGNFYPSWDDLREWNTITSLGGYLYAGVYQGGIYKVATDVTLASAIPSGKSVVVTDIIPYSTAEITLTITGSGSVNCGHIVIGYAYDLGQLEYGATVGILDYSTKTTSPSGSITFTRRAFSKRITARLFLSNSQINQIFQILSTIRSTPCAWVGISTEDYAPLTVFGFYRDFSIEIAYFDTSYCSLEIEGLSE